MHVYARIWRDRMSEESNLLIRHAIAALVLTGGVLMAAAAAAADYHPITPDAKDKVITLTGRDLTIEDVVAVARHGAKVRYSPDAIQRASDGRGLRAEAGAEGMPVYGLNRGGGALREVVTHDEDTRRIKEMRHGAREGVLPEIADEDLVRAFLVIRANSVPYEVATPEFMQMIVDLL